MLLGLVKNMNVVETGEAPTLDQSQTHGPPLTVFPSDLHCVVDDAVQHSQQPVHDYDPVCSVYNQMLVHNTFKGKLSLKLKLEVYK